MRILWMTWKDQSNPLAGGAEVVQHELASRLVADGHEVTILTGGYHGAGAEEVVEAGYRVIRVGGRYSVYWHAYRYYRSNLIGWADYVIDEMNTIPFFAKFYVQEKRVMLIHQLCREIWFYQMVSPLSLIGYLIEPLYLRILSSEKVITVSQSTKDDLMRYGFHEEDIQIISEGIEMMPVGDVSVVTKSEKPTVLCFGAMRAMKRTLETVKAFELLKKSIPDARLVIAGDDSGAYAQKVRSYIERSPYKVDITIKGRVSTQEKISLMRQSHVIAVTSIKEGWGLIVTEAASQGTPAVVYNVDGLRDSVRHGDTGLICGENSPQDLARNIEKMLTDKSYYSTVQENGWQWSKGVTFEKGYEEIFEVLSTI